MSGSCFFCLNPQYSTTRTVIKERSIIGNDSLSQIQPKPFLPSHAQRQGEGGLKTKGYFKKTLANKPLVTVITVVYNRQHHMAKTIESVLNQNYDNVEYVIIDGGSNDGTVDIIRTYDHAIDYWVSEPDSGIGDAFNKGIIASTGGWINFMNCGDRFASADVVRDIVDNIDEKADVIFGKANVVDSQGKIIITAGKVFDENKFLRGRMIPHQSTFHNRHYFQQYGLFDNELKMAMCYEILLRKRPLSTVFIDKTLSNFLVGGVNETNDYLRLKEARMVKKKYCADTGNLTIEFDYCHALGRALIKRSLIRIGLGSIARKIRQIENKYK
jgi:glycosyltransferase involved in cell wall biosynthesis